MANEPMRVLIIEDTDDDAILMMREVKREYKDTIFRHVDSAEGLEDALTSSSWDIILSDYSLPGFDALQALEIVHQHRLDIPVIIVSGTVSEDVAVAAMRAGAVDFFSKGKIQRLVPAMNREIRDAQNRKKRHSVEAELMLKNRALEASPLGVIITDPEQDDNPIIYVNAAFEDMTGYATSDVMGRNCRFLQADDTDQPGLQEIRRAIQERRECNVILRNYRKDGEMFWNQLRIAPIWDSDGQLIHFVGMLNDITQQKTSEEEVRSLYMATSILFHANNLLELGRVISDTIVREFNYVDCGVMLTDDSMKKLIRLPRAGELAITPTIELMVEGNGLVPTAVRTGEIIYAPDVSQHPAYRVGSSKTRCELVIPLKTSQRVIGVMDLQSEMVNAFSERDRRVLAAYAEHASAALEIVKLVEEINRRAAELEWRVARRTIELERAKDQVETVLNSVGDAIVVLDAQTRIVQANTAFESSFGFSRQAFEQQVFANSQLFEKPEDVLAHIERVKETGIPQRGEFKCLHSSRNAFDGEVVFAIVPAEYPEDILVVCSIRDISTQKHLEASLRESLSRANELAEMKARFTSMISHEFRTPLAVILTAAQLLSIYFDKLSEESRKEKLDSIQGQVKHLTQLTDGVLMLGQAETVGLAYQPHSLDLIAFCESVIEDLQSISRKRHSIQFAATGCGSLVHADDRLLGHILRNLVSNAIKYSPRGGVIDVQLGCTPEIITLTVKDEGIGIPEEAQKHLFEMFHRAGNVGAIAGTGLGLSIVKNAVDTYGGSISFSSVEQKGTTFVVKLPITTEGENQPPQAR